MRPVKPQIDAIFQIDIMPLKYLLRLNPVVISTTFGNAISRASWRIVELATHFIQLCENKKETMLHLVTEYSSTYAIISTQIDKIRRTQQRLNQELILHVKGI